MLTERDAVGVGKGACALLLIDCNEIGSPDPARLAACARELVGGNRATMGRQRPGEK
jgi:hypothetical protein